MCELSPLLTFLAVVISNIIVMAVDHGIFKNQNIDANNIIEAIINSLPKRKTEEK